MAAIAIIDDWGKEQHRIKIAGDANDIANDVLHMLSGDGEWEQCVTCETFVKYADAVLVDSDNVEYACRSCMAPKEST